MAGLSERLYVSSYDEDSQCNDKMIGQFPDPNSCREIINESKLTEVLYHPKVSDETPNKDSPPKVQS